MKKNGRKWRKLHKKLPASNLVTKIDLEKETQTKELRSLPMTQQDIDTLREKANSILESSIRYEEFKRERYEIDLQKYQERKCVFYWSSYRYDLYDKFESLEERLSYCYISFIGEINTLFGFAKKRKTAERIFERIVLHKRDLVKENISSFGQCYINAICDILKGSTWYTRKHAELILKQLYDKFDQQITVD